jgi:hypothetical protein
MLDGKVFEGGVASDFKMVLGKGSMIKGFEEGLKGFALPCIQSLAQLALLKFCPHQIE